MQESIPAEFVTEFFFQWRFLITTDVLYDAMWVPMLVEFFTVKSALAQCAVWCKSKSAC